VERSVKSAGPTARQAEYLAFIASFTDRHGMPPSFDELGRHFRATPPSVNDMLKRLEARGFLARVPGAPRTLRVLLDPRTDEGVRDAARVSDEVARSVRVGALTLERLVPVLQGLDEERVHAAVRAVLDAVDVACAAAGADEAERDEATEDLRRTAIVAMRRRVEPRRRR
jgi:SOS-response transcriptional repressor LexA